MSVPPPNRIAWFRNTEDLSLRELSLKLEPSGMGPHERTINRWERMEGGVPDKWKFALAEVFGCSVPVLMGWEDLPDDDIESAAA